MPTKDLVVCWISSSAAGSFKEESPKKSIHIQLSFGSCWVLASGIVILPKPYHFEVFSNDSHNGNHSPKIVSSGESMRIEAHPGTDLRVYTPDGILRVLMSFPVSDERFYDSLHTEQLS